MKKLLRTLKENSKSLEEYLDSFKFTCDNLVAIKNANFRPWQCLQFACDLGSKYMNFRIFHASKVPMPDFEKLIWSTVVKSYDQTNKKIIHIYIYIYIYIYNTFLAYGNPTLSYSIYHSLVGVKCLFSSFFSEKNEDWAFNIYIYIFNEIINQEIC